MTATRRPNRRDFLMQLVAGGALLAVLSGCAQITAQPGHSGQPGPLGDPRVMKFDPVTFTIPEVERIVLENGIIVYLLPDPELPLVTVSALIRTGAVYEPPEKVGLATLTGTVMRTGGTARMTGDPIDAALEFLAANVAIGIGSENGTASLDILKKDLERGLAIFAEIGRASGREGV